MPAPSAEFKRAVKQLSEKEKEALILKAVRRDAELYEMFAFELLEDVTLEQLAADAEDRIHALLLHTSGRSLNKSLTRALRKAQKEIARFKRITKDVKAEIDLHLYLLRLIFDNFSGQFDSYQKGFYTATARLLLRTIQLIRKHLHEDYHIEYEGTLNDYLEQLHSYHKPLSFDLPKRFESER